MPVMALLVIQTSPLWAGGATVGAPECLFVVITQQANSYRAVGSEVRVGHV